MTSEKRGKKNFVEKNSITSPHCPAYHYFFYSTATCQSVQPSSGTEKKCSCKHLHIYTHSERFSQLGTPPCIL